MRSKHLHYDDATATAVLMKGNFSAQRLCQQLWNIILFSHHFMILLYCIHKFHVVFAL